jgi:NAD(P)-dependent dehydrogenase (short-subunit alcohol dehydrogenase family)
MSKVVVVTGAARGIGLATAKKFLSEGDGKTQDLARNNLNEPGNTLAIECDVSDPDQVANAIKEVVAKFNHIDALVNNAGIAVFKPVMQTSFEEWSRVLAVNLNGPFICTQACVPAMLARGGGSIVNITSISGVRASTLRVAYGTSKAALMHMTKQQAVEFGNQGIRVNAVSPGPVDTAMAKKVHTPDIRSDYHDAIPLNRYGTEEELAEATYFLCSDKASYITGHTLNVDGGFAATGIGLPSVRNTD